MMKKVFGIYLITLLLFSAWSNAGLLATHSFTDSGISCDPITETVTFTFTTLPFGAPANSDIRLTWEGISEQDIGKTFHITSDMDPDFAAIEERLTNGTTDLMSYSIYMPDLNGGGAGTGAIDTRLKDGIDLAGNDLVSISLTVNELVLNGVDDYSWKVAWGFWDEPIPEPATSLLFCLGTLFIQRMRFAK